MSDEAKKVSEAKGPYSTGDSVGLVFKDGRGIENFDSERDKLNACRLANSAWSAGIAEGLRMAADLMRARDLIPYEDILTKAKEYDDMWKCGKGK